MAVYQTNFGSNPTFARLFRERNLRKDKSIVGKRVVSKKIIKRTPPTLVGTFIKGSVSKAKANIEQQKTQKTSSKMYFAKGYVTSQVKLAKFLGPTITGWVNPELGRDVQISNRIAEINQQRTLEKLNKAISESKTRQTEHETSSYIAQREQAALKDLSKESFLEYFGIGTSSREQQLTDEQVGRIYDIAGQQGYLQNLQTQTALQEILNTQRIQAETAGLDISYIPESLPSIVSPSPAGTGQFPNWILPVGIGLAALLFLKK